MGHGIMFRTDHWSLQTWPDGSIITSSHIHTPASATHYLKKLNANLVDTSPFRKSSFVAIVIFVSDACHSDITVQFASQEIQIKDEIEWCQSPLLNIHEGISKDFISRPIPLSLPVRVSQKFTERCKYLANWDKTFK